ncbi:MAG: hypothetical protein LLG43_01860 [Deltaproteobacteria bacterium]|nr:hypothetical protein [Deltaproteobacteria bacterium]
MVKKAPSPYDDYTARCPMLGHLVPFTYCREPGTELPCRKILDCWHERIDIEAFLRESLSLEELDAILAPPKQKISQIMELIRKAKEGK